MDAPPLAFRVLGPLEVDRDGLPLRIAGQKPKSVLALLLLSPGRVISTAELIRGIWGDEATDKAVATLQVHVSNLRKLFAAAEPALLTQAPGYTLHATADNLDLVRFDDLLRAAGEASTSGAPEEAEHLLDAALGLWRGQALADLDESPAIELARTWLEDRRLAAVEDRMGLRLRLGQHRRVVAEAETLVAEHPLRESLWESLIVALYRSGRQADALAAYSRARARLLEELGIEPGARLRALELAVLSQDASLDLAARDVAEGPPVTLRVGGPAHARLELEDGTLVDVVDRLTIGRHPDCDLTLADPLISRHHAEIRAVGGGFLLVDTSSNGSRINGAPAVQAVLADGDEVEIGAHRMTFHQVPQPQA